MVADPLRLRYFANLTAGKSTIDITNAGMSGAGLDSTETAAATGALCVSVYTFAPDQQLISCCSCAITPNGLATLDVAQDLTSSTLTPGVESSVTVELLASLPVSESCNNSASAPGPLASGMEAWATTVHAAPSAGTFQATETPFTRATLSDTEFKKMTQLCGFIQADGSGYGICNSCKVGAAGAAKR